MYVDAYENDEVINKSKIQNLNRREDWEREQEKSRGLILL
jgi:hypothetical protein